MTITESVKSVITQYATFTGRASRSEYWWFSLASFLVGLPFYFLEKMEGGLGTLFTIISVLISLAIFVPSLAVTWRRLHDIGRSGAFFFFVFIPLVGPILLIVWLATGTRAAGNRYDVLVPAESAN